MKIILTVAQVLISLSLIILITLQSKGGGLGTAFGTSQALYSQRRGVEKLVFQITIVTAFLFFVVSIANLLI